MKLTTKGKYALMALKDMKENRVFYDDRYVPIRVVDISWRTNISTSYLEQLFRLLKDRNIVKAIRGPKGGYILTKKASETTIYEILKAVNERINIDCQLPVFDRVNELTNETLRNYTLNDI